MEILLAGAGAVGQVYGRHLALGGARVSVLVRPGRAEAVRAGLRMIPLRGRGRPVEPVLFRPERVLTTLGEVEATRWDQLWLCLPTDALEGPFVEALLLAAGDATVVFLQPGMHVRRRLAALAPDARLVAGAIAMVAYAAPLPGEDLPTGTAYTFPLRGPSRFSGARAEEVVEALRRGGCPARVDPDARRFLSLTSAIIQPLMVALEGAGWSVTSLRQGPLLPVALGAAREAVAVAGAEVGFRPPLLRHALRPWPARLALRLLPRLAPFDLEAYLRAHFTKVRAQTRLLLPRYREQAGAHGLPATSLRALERSVLGPAPSEPSGGEAGAHG